MHNGEQIIEQYKEILEFVLNEGINFSLSNYQELLQEDIIDENISDFITETVFELTSNYAEGIIEYLVENNLFETKEGQEYFATAVGAYVRGVTDALLAEISLSPQMKEKLKKALKWGSLGAAALGAIGAGAYAATHPEHVKDMAHSAAEHIKQAASEVSRKFEHGLEDIKQKALHILGSHLHHPKK